MDLELTPEQQMLRDAVRDLCAKHGDPDHLRELEDDPVGYDEAFWRELASMDLIGLTLPPEHGGSGMTALESMVVFQELGRAIVPSPLLVSAVVGGGLLAAAGSEDLQRDWLPRVAAGDAVLTLAWHEAGRSDGPEGVALTATADGDELVLTGTKIVVPFASRADALLVLARSGPRPEDVDLVLVESDADGLAMEQTTVVDSSAQYEVRFDRVRVPSGQRIGAPGEGWSAFVDVVDDALVAVAAMAVGGAQQLLDMSVAYAGERVQFGVPIGNFQGVAHPIADVATEVEGARTLVLHAAWSRSVAGVGGARTALAKRFACETYRRAARTAHQVYGGIGFTRAIDVQLYFRRAKQLELDWFEPRTLGERIAAAELDDEQPLVTVDAGV